MAKIKTLQEYINNVEAISKQWGSLSYTTTHPWFRGQSEEIWGLLPKLYRKTENPKYEREMFRDFKLRASAYLDHIPQNDMEWLFLMQHYGMPTRLLDWTESHLNALFFAVVSLDKKDGAVWIVEPWSLNLSFFKTQSIPTSDHKSFSKYVLDLQNSDVDKQREIGMPYPIALRPARNSPRIIAQKGTFTIHGKEQVSLDEFATNKTGKTPNIRLEKLIIDGAYKKELLQQLYLAGISSSTIFPELEGLSKEISFRYSREYMS